MDAIRNLRLWGTFSKLINIPKILFFYVGAICNLAIEFNGLVSTKGQQKC